MRSDTCACVGVVEEGTWGSIGSRTGDNGVIIGRGDLGAFSTLMSSTSLDDRQFHCLVSTLQGPFRRKDDQRLVSVGACPREIEAQGWVVCDDGDVVAAEELSRRPAAWDDVLGLCACRRALAVLEGV